MLTRDPDILTVAMRAYAPPILDGSELRAEAERSERRERNRDRPIPKRPSLMLVFDTETTIDPTQRLTFGSARLYLRAANLATGNLVTDYGAIAQALHSPTGLARMLGYRQEPLWACRLCGALQVSMRPLPAKRICAHLGRECSAPGWKLSDEWIFHADDLAATDPSGFATLTEHVGGLHTEHSVQLCTRTQFVNGPFWKLAYKARALVVGFNLPFDLSRLALAWGEGRRTHPKQADGTVHKDAPWLDGNAGSFSFRLWELYQGAENQYRPRVLVKKLAPGRNLIRFGAPYCLDQDDRIPEDDRRGTVDDQSRWRFAGHFLDVHTLAFALTSNRHSLASACEAFKVEHGKTQTEEHGRITASYVEYNRRDVEATYELAVKTLEEFDRHPISPDYGGKVSGAAGHRPTLQETKAYSPASIGKGYLHSMGIRPITERQPDFPRDILGRCMAAFYGGRSECRIRNTSVPVILLDFRSMYPAVNALMGNWSLLTALRIEIETATVAVCDLVARVGSLGADAVLDPEMWGSLCTLVECAPDGGRFPVRAQYGGRADGFTIGVNPLHSEGRSCWYMLADVLASVLLTGLVPEVRSAIRFVPRGRQSGLCPTLLGGELRVRPETDDFFRRVIEERIALDKLDRNYQFLKILANASSYGIFAEMQRRELPAGETREVVVYSDRPMFQARTAAPESPGEYCFPPIAASITAAARLMLATLERLVTDAGGSFAFCDTDSMAVVATLDGGVLPCPGGPHGRGVIGALSFTEVEAIRQRFTAVNPFTSAQAVPDSLLQYVSECWDVQSARPRVLRCLAVSAKRYCLYTLRRNGEPGVIDYGEGEEGDAENARVAKYSEHGLGAFLSPTDRAPFTNPELRRRWITDYWLAHIRSIESGREIVLPSWAETMAVSRLTISTPMLARVFRHYNAAAAPEARIRPFNFLLAAHVEPISGVPRGVDRASFHLVTPYERDGRRWSRVRWLNLYETRRNGATNGHGIVEVRPPEVRPPGEAFTVSVARDDTLGSAREGHALVRSISAILRQYSRHPERKSAGSDGRVCRPETVGWLTPRTVRVGLIRYIGKESNRLDEREAGIIRSAAEVLNQYALPIEADETWAEALALIATLPRAETAGALRVNDRTVRKLLSGERRPSPRMRDRMVDYAQQHPAEDGAAVCAGCGQPLTDSRQRWCDHACRMRTLRAAAQAAAPRTEWECEPEPVATEPPQPAPQWAEAALAQLLAAKMSAAQTSILARISAATRVEELDAPWRPKPRQSVRS